MDIIRAASVSNLYKYDPWGSVLANPRFAQVIYDTDPTNLRFLWPMQEYTGTLCSDISGNARHGTYDGATLNGIGPNARVDAWPEFDAVNDKITTTGNNNSVKGLAVVTIQAVISVVNLAASQTIWEESVADGNNGRITVLLNSTENLLCAARSGLAAQTLSTKTSDAAVAVGNHIVHAQVDIANDTISLFVDGVSVAATGTINFGTDTIFADTAPLTNPRAGASIGGSLFFGGNIAYLAMWGSLLTAAQMLTIARAGGFAS